MANDRTPPDLQGFLLPARQFTASNLVAKNDGTTPSTYTQSGRRTGVPKATADTAMVIQGSGTQDEDGHIEIVCQRAGMPGGRGGFIWRDEAAGDSASQFYGHEGPQLMTGHSALDWTTTARVVGFTPHAIRLDNGTLFAFYGNQTAANQLLTATYSPATSAWTKVSFAPGTLDWDVNAGTCVQLPKASGDAVGRLLVFYDARSGRQVDMAYSDDSGASWAIGARGVLETMTGGTIVGLRAAYSGGQIALLASYLDGTSKHTHDQYASVSFGASFAQVESDFQAVATEASDTPNIVAALGGGFVVATHKFTSAVGVRVRRIGSAFAKLSTVAASSSAFGGAVSGTTPGLLMYRDEDETLYIVNNQQSTVDVLTVWSSTDDGVTWTGFADSVDMRLWGNVDAYLHTFGGGVIGGRLFLLARHADNGGSAYDPRSVTAYHFGGYSRMTFPAHLDAVDFLVADFGAWGSDPNYGVTGTNLTGQLWFPIELPDQIGSVWTLTSANSPTVAIASTAELSITTGATATNYYTHSFDTALTTGAPLPLKDATQIVAEFAVEIDSGDGDQTTRDISARLRFSDGNASVNSTFIYDVTVRFSSAGYRVYDELASPTQVGGTQALDFTSRKHVRIAVDNFGNVKTWHCADEHARRWAAGVSATSLTSGGAGTALSLIEWGHVTAAANVSRWALVGMCAWSSRFGPHATGSAAKSYTNPTDLLPRAFPVSPTLVGGGVQMKSTDGPALKGDTWDIEARYDHPVSQWFADDPSPRRRGRSTGDNANQDLVIKQDATSSASMLNGSTVGAFVRGANFPDFTLDRWTGSAWATVASATGEITTLQFTRNGRYIVVNTGTVATASQFIRWGDLVGGTFAFDDGTLRTILRNTSGAWTDKVTNRVSLELDPDEMTGSEPTSGTAGKVWFSDYGVIAHDYAATSQIFRIRIPTSQTARDYYTGKFIVGPVAVFGWSHDRTWSLREEHDVEVVTRPGGLRHGVKRAPTRRVLQIGWVDTSIDESQTLAGLSASFVPDYVAANTNPSATRHATISDVLGIMREQSGPSDPVIMLRAIKPGASSQQYLGSHLWIHGRIETTDPQVDNLLGREATDPMSKLNQIAITEEV